MSGTPIEIIQIDKYRTPRVLMVPNRPADKSNFFFLVFTAD